MAVIVKIGKGKSVDRARRHLRVCKKFSGTPARSRLVVSRSSRHVFVQVIDDVAGVTIDFASTMDVD